MDKRAENVKTRVRAKYFCKPELADLIQRANLIQETLCDLVSLRKRGRDDFENEMAQLIFRLLADKYGLILELREENRRFIHHLKMAFDSLILENSGATSDSLSEIREDYRNLKAFREIAKYFQDKNDGKDEFSQIMPALMVGTRIADDNTLRLEQTDLMKIIDGVNLERIRSCEICQRIFWAKRIESQTCSKKCLNALGARKHRQKGGLEKNISNEKSKDSSKRKRNDEIFEALNFQDDE